MVAYSVGRQNVPASNAPVAVMTSPSVLAKPVAYSTRAGDPAHVRMTRHETEALAADEARIPVRAVPRRFAIRAT